VYVHHEYMKELKLPYSNVIRPHSQRLTGLHVVRTKHYFETVTQRAMTEALRAYGKIGDEQFLYRLMQDRLGLPKKVVPRPVHGIHISPQRPIMASKGVHWGVAPHQDRYREMTQTKAWQDMLPLFHHTFQTKIKKLEHYIAMHLSEDQDAGPATS
jgi:hypothetical protein